MAAFRVDQSVELNNPRDQSVPNLYAHGATRAHVWAVTLTRNSTAEDLTGYTAMALHRRSDGGTVTIDTFSSWISLDTLSFYVGL